MIGVAADSTSTARFVSEVARGGGLPALDLQGQVSRERLTVARRVAGGPVAVRVGDVTGAVALADLADDLVDVVATVIVAAGAREAVDGLGSRFRMLFEVAGVEELADAVTAGADGVVVRGAESAGPVGDLSGFSLLQWVLTHHDIPVWVSGVGLHVARGAILAGASGVVLDEQLALLTGFSAPDSLRAVLEPGVVDTEVVDGRRLARTHVDDGSPGVPVGQAAFLAARYRRTHRTVSGTVRAFVGVVEATAAAARTLADYLDRDEDLVRVFGSRLPVAQGPMTRVSDTPAFARAVADADGLPFTALASAGPEAARSMLDAAAQELEGRPWGAGVLGFLPGPLVDAHLDAIERVRPSWVLLAGGRLAQVRRLQDAGISTIAHVPSAVLLRQFLDGGARGFVLEGAECGGHVGPLFSFPLWELQIDVLVEHVDRTGDPDLTVVLAGGIHDERSAVLALGAALPLIERGVRVGLLLGTAYLCTTEAVDSGAITLQYQKRVLAARTTSVVTSAPGHSARCVPSPFVEEHAALRARLTASGTDAREAWEQLERLTVGRLRVASKGIERRDGGLVTVPLRRQAREGMFMAGEVSVLRDRATTISALHHGLTTGARALLTERIAAAVPDPAQADPGPGPARGPLDIAIVGMAGVFPGAATLDEYWANVLAARSAVGTVPDGRWDAGTYAAPGTGRVARSATTAGAFLPPVPFDPLAYGIPPTSMATIDPAQLLSLHVADAALHDAGLGPQRRSKARTAVVFGVESGSDLASAMSVRTGLPGLLGDLPETLDDVLPAITPDTFPGMLANVVAGRITNRLDLGGMNCVVDAACASSLAALNVACSELALGRCDVALAGGADLHNGITDYIMFSSLGALSARGRADVFDRSADGIVLGEGVGCVVLKRLADARRDGDRVYAVVRGIGTSSDGRALGLTAPRVEGQVVAVSRALDAAGVRASDVSLVEAHGTGTALGDRSELAALTEVFQGDGAAVGGCVLGSVKSQIGHTKCAAGMAGLIKAALAVHTGVLPPMVGPQAPVEEWDVGASPFRFLARPAPWVPSAGRRIAGVSAFGFGGTNFHVVLDEDETEPRPAHGVQEWSAELVLIRARTPEAARARLEDLRPELERLGTAAELRAVARRESWARPSAHDVPQLAFVASSVAELATQIDAVLGGRSCEGVLVRPARAVERGKVAVLFPGQGSQRVDMHAELLTTFPDLLTTSATCGVLAATVYPGRAFGEDVASAQRAAVTATQVAQPALGVVGLATLGLLHRAGLRADAYAGHSYGELTALAAAGVVDAAGLLRLSTERGRAMGAAAAEGDGAMAAVSAPATDVRVWLAEHAVGEHVVVANENSPHQTVISGPTDHVATAVQVLTARGATCRRLRVAAAFHSPAMRGAAADFARSTADVRLRAPSVPVWCGRTARPHGDDVRAELTAQICDPVRFATLVLTMHDQGFRTFIEVGPGSVLGRLVADTLDGRPALITGVEQHGSGVRGLLLMLGELLVTGHAVDIGWLFADRTVLRDPAPTRSSRWTVDGQLVRDETGQPLARGLRPDKQAALLDEMRRRVDERASGSEGLLVPLPHPAGPPDPAAPTRSQPRTDGGIEMSTSKAIGHADAAVVEAFLRSTAEVVASQERLVAQYLSRGAPHARVEAPPVLVPAAPDPAAPGPAGGAPRLPDATLPVVAPARAVVVPDTGRPPATGPSPAPVPVEVDEVASPVPLSVAAVEAAVREVIARSTGYPVDMIGVDLDLESDLSVDSIKRMEIAGELVGVLGLDPQQLGEHEVEELAGARTVAAITAWWESRSPHGTAVTPPAGVSTEDDRSTAPGPGDPANAGAAPQRYVVEEVPEPVAPGAVPEGEVDVFADGELGEHLRGEIASRGGRAYTCRTAEVVSASAGTTLYVVPRSGAEESEHLLARVFDDLRTLIQVARPTRLLVVCAAPVGCASARVPGLRGLVRTLAREFSGAAVRLLEIGPDAPTDPGARARAVVDELATPGEVDVAVLGGRRAVLALRPLSLGPVADVGSGSAGAGAAEREVLGIGSASVVMAFGGARGITAQVVERIAEGGPCRFELCGSTPTPDLDELARWEQALTTTDLRRLIASGGHRSPREVDALARRVAAQREIRSTTERLERWGSEVRYQQVDVLDPGATARHVSRSAQEHGAPDLLIYGSGITRDRKFLDLTPADLQVVLDVKVAGLRTVLESFREAGVVPRHLVAFGSVAAVVGNAGQAVYAAANDALECLVDDWATSTPGVRAATTHWGAWAPTGRHEGMVDDTLAREFHRRGIALLSPEHATDRVLQELAWGGTQGTAVTYATADWASTAGGRRP